MLCDSKSVVEGIGNFHAAEGIVGRCIDTVIPWADIKKRLEQQEKQIINKKRKTME
jgi:hypothetical protein